MKYIRIQIKKILPLLFCKKPNVMGARSKIEIIVIEEKSNLNSIFKNSNSFKNYHFTFFSDSLEALSFIVSNHKNIQLIILDYHIPSLDGIEIINKTKEAGLNLNFLFISNEDSAKNAVKAIQSGAIDYIVINPNLESELPAIIERAINTSKEKSSVNEEDIQKTNGALTQIADNIPVFVSVVNKDLEYIFVNREYEIFFKLNRREIIGRKVRDIVGNAAFERAYPNIIKALNGQTHTFENHLLNKEGEDRIIKTTYTPYYRDNAISGLIILVIDITEQKQAEESLRENEQLYHSMFDKTQAIKLIIDPSDGSIIDANPAAVQYYGYSLQQLKSLKISAINTLSASQIQVEMDDAALERRSYFNFRHKLSSGEIRDVEVYSSPIKIGGRTFLHSIIHDITDRKLAEKKLFESATQWKTTFDTVNDGICIIDIDQHIVRCNNVMTDLFPKSGKNLIGLNCWEVVHGTNEHFHDCPIKKMKETLQRESLELKFDDRWFHITVDPLFGVDNNLTGAIHIVRDITERKMAEEALEKSELKYRIVADNTNDWEFWVNPEGKFLYSSPSCLQITGYNPIDFINDANLELKIVHPDDVDRLKNHIKYVDRERVASGIDYRIILPNGEIKWIGHKCQPVFDSNNEYLGFRGSNRDVTYKKLAEIEIEESNKKLKELNTSKDKFFSIIAHDLINPFSTLLGFSELLMENIHNYPPDKIEGQVQIINDAAKSCFSLLDNLLTWSRSQISSIEINPKEIDLESITSELVKQFHPLTLRKHINIISTINSQTIAFADENMVRTIIRNLISNAIKFTRIGGIVVLSSNEKDGQIEYCVEDNGVGMTQEVIDNLFQIDKNVSTSGTDKEKGSGLGLILCKEFAEKNGGKIWVISEPGKGSEFRFSLPRKNCNPTN